MSKKITGLKILAGHNEQCDSKSRRWFIPAYENPLLYRDSLGRCNGTNYRWKKLQCVNSRCSGCALVRLDILEMYLGNTIERLLKESK